MSSGPRGADPVAAGRDGRGPASAARRRVAPFAGVATGLLPMRRETRGRSFAVVPSERAAEVIGLVARLKALARWQIVHLLRLRSDKVIRTLYLTGYLDRLTTAETPPVYVLGPESLALLGRGDEVWDVLRMLRLVAANQLYLRLRCGWPDLEYELEPHLGVTAYLRLGGREYSLLCPRVWPGDSIWCREMVALLPADAFAIILAGSEETAWELARIVPADGPVLRFLWDGLLCDPDPALRARDGRKRLYPAEKIFAPPLDKDAVDGVP